MGSSSLTRNGTWPPALGAWNLSHWTTREVPVLVMLFLNLVLTPGINSGTSHVWFVQIIDYGLCTFLHKFDTLMKRSKKKKKRTGPLPHQAPPLPDVVFPSDNGLNFPLSCPSQKLGVIPCYSPLIVTHNQALSVYLLTISQIHPLLSPSAAFSLTQTQLPLGFCFCSSLPDSKHILLIHPHTATRGNLLE